MPGLRLNDPHAIRSPDLVSVRSAGIRSPSAGSPGSGGPGGPLLSVGSIVLHDTLRCDILRSPIAHLGSKSLAPGQPVFVMSRLTLQLRFVQVEPDHSKMSNARAGESPGGRGLLLDSNTSALEYVDGRIHLSTSMALPTGEQWGEPLHLADSLAGEAHYERIVSAGSALLHDLRTANINREENPKRRPTGGFLVRQAGAPVVGMLGSQWIDGEDGSRHTPITRSHDRHFSGMTSVSAPLEPIPEQSGGDSPSPSFSSAAYSPSLSHTAGGNGGCSHSHWEGEPSGSGSDEIIFHLRPIFRCSHCGIKPLQLLHSTSGSRAGHSTSTAVHRQNSPLSARTPTTASQLRGPQQSLPNKTYRAVCNLLSYHDPDERENIPDEFYAHFRIVFHFSDDRNYSSMPRDNEEPKPRTAAAAESPRFEKGCCRERHHVFQASIKIGKEADQKLRQKKELDFNDALARLEGKGNGGARYDRGIKGASSRSR